MAAGRHRFAGLALLAAALAAPPVAAWAFTCEASGGRPWRELTSEHFVVATDRNADDPAMLAGLTRDLVAVGRSGMAMPVVRRMLAVAPHSWGVHVAAATAASDLGACGDAIALQRRALQLLPERAPASLRRDLAVTLSAYGRQCAPAPETETPRPDGGGASNPAGPPAIRG